MQLARRPHLLAALALLTAMPSAAVALRGPQGKRAPNGEDPTTVQDFEEGDKARNTQNPADIVNALHLSPGDCVADVGAGDGYYSMRLSTVVGPNGKVFAEDIWDMAITWSTRRVAAFQLKNVVVLKGSNDDPKLPENTLSGALVVDAYHHFTHYEAMNRKIFEALRPGGRLVVADYSLPLNRGEPRLNQIKMHEISPDLVEAELQQVGFVVLERRDPFIRRITDAKNGDRRITAADMWLMIAIKPKH